MSIINTFAEDGYKIDYDWAWHLANPKLTPIPGQDYKVPPGGVVRAPATGYCSWAQMDDGLYLVSIQYGADAITIRELGTVASIVKYAHHVTQGQAIGTASHTLSPHIEYDHADGTYSRFEDHVTPPPTPPKAKVKEMLLIQSETKKADFFIVGELSFEAINQGRATTEARNWGTPLQRSEAEILIYKQDVNARRSSLGFTAIA